MPILTEDQRRFYDENGYLIVRQVLSAEEVKPIYDAVWSIAMGEAEGVRNRQVFSAGGGTQSTIVIHCFRANPVLEQYLHHPVIGEITAELMESDEVYLFYDKIAHKVPQKGSVLSCHQDYYYWRDVSTTNMCSSWLALSRAVEESGGMYYIPGSHKWGSIDYELNPLWDEATEASLMQKLTEEQRKAFVRVPIELEPGDVAFHHALTFHGSYPNVSDYHRLGYIQHCFPSDARYIAANDTRKNHGIEVADGELIRGESFPMCWARDKVSIV